MRSLHSLVNVTSTTEIPYTEDPWIPTSQKSSQHELPQEESGISADDASWIITNAFIIFTMQSGFSLLESGVVSKKNEVNIMVKNVVDVVLGGFTYWLFGYGLSFGTGPGSSPFCGVGSFMVDAEVHEWGTVFTNFFFQLSFATTATTIVSGAMAERCNFNAYCLFSLFNTLVYCIPAGWLWSDTGFLNQLGVVDIAGSGGVHLVGGASAFVSAAMLKPRLGRYDHGTEQSVMGDPITAILGMFMLWWGWLSFNCGSTYGLSGYKWKYATRASVVTMCGSFGGGFVGMLFSYITKNRKFDVSTLINGVLAALVSITAGCALYRPWEAIIVGIIGSTFALAAVPLIDYLHVDDPVGAVAVHAFAGAWGLIAVGVFCDADPGIKYTHDRAGILKGGGFELFGVQLLAVVCLISWSMISSFILLYLINLVVPIRLTEEEEIIGADYLEHNVIRTPEIRKLAIEMEAREKEEREKKAKEKEAKEKGLTKKDIYSVETNGDKEKLPKRHVIIINSSNNNQQRPSTTGGNANGSIVPSSEIQRRKAWY